MKPFFKTDEHFENPFFIGEVVDNKDPTFNYRVKVRIAHLHDTIMKDENLPWAAKVDSSFMGMDSSSISHSVPEVGSKVLVLAVGDNINSLIYLGCLYKKTDSTPSGDDYTNCYGIYDKNGNYIKLDKIQKLLELVWAGKINIDKVTEMKITVNGNVTVTASGNVDVKANTTNITAPNNTIKGNVTVNGTLDVSGQITGKADIRAGGGSVGILTHTHGGVFPGPSSTSPGQG